LRREESQALALRCFGPPFDFARKTAALRSGCGPQHDSYKFRQSPRSGLRDE